MLLGACAAPRGDDEFPGPLTPPLNAVDTAGVKRAAQAALAAAPAPDAGRGADAVAADPAAPRAAGNEADPLADPAAHAVADQLADPVAAPVASAPLSWPDPLPPFAADITPLRKGLVAGSWAAESAEDFERTWFDEAAVREVFTGHSAGRRAWRGFASNNEAVPMDNLLTDRDGGRLGYVYSLNSRLTPPEGLPDQAAILHVRHRGRLRAWWDGVLVLDAPASTEESETRVPVTMTGPYDVLLLKLARGRELGTAMDFSIRVSAADGSALAGQEWRTMRPPGLPSDLPPREGFPDASYGAAHDEVAPDAAPDGSADEAPEADTEPDAAPDEHAPEGDLRPR